MMNETLVANQRIEPGDQPQPLTVLGWAMLLGWTVGVFCGAGLAVALHGYAWR